MVVLSNSCSVVNLNTSQYGLLVFMCEKEDLQMMTILRPLGEKIKQV